MNMVSSQVYPKREYRVNKWLVWGLIASIILNVIAYVSPWFTVNPLVVWAVVMLVAIYFAYVYLSSRVTESNAYKVIWDICEQHAHQLGLQLPTDNVQVKEFAPNYFLVNFKEDGLTFEYRNGVIKSFYRRSLGKAWSDLEKSKFTDVLLKLGVQEEKVRLAAKQMGFEIPGLTDKEEVS